MSRCTSTHLFLSHPEVRSMFPIQMSGQRDKLVTALGAVVSNVDEIDKVLPLSWSSWVVTTGASRW